MTRLRLEVPPRRGSSLEVTPGIEAVRAMAGAHGQAPLVHTYIADCETPVSAYLKLRDGGPAFLLESVEHGRLGRYSMIGVRPQAVVRGAGGRLTVTDEAGTRELDAADPFGAVEDVVRGVGMAPPPEPLAFWGGAVGFFGYDLVRTVERLPDVPADDLGVPDLTAMITGPVVVFDHLRRSLSIVAPCPIEPDGDVEAAYWRTVATVAELKGRLSGPLPRPADREGEPVLGPVASNLSRERFEAGVERAREYIYAGDAFQIVPSQRFSAPMTLDPFAVYRGLRTVNPSPYMFFLETGEVTLVGSSPEMLVKVAGGHVEMHPIAGSRPRGATEEEDEALAEELLADPKERAEHVMLVDLGRNDLGRVSEIGTVQVTDLMDVRRYSHVMHIESSVTGRLAAGRRASDALRATFPAGTLSGAPKVRAMEIIDELEPTKRGPYGGAVGWLGWDGDMDTCITIRTIVCKDGMAHVQAGAGIVADSVPATEYEETQNKAAALFRAIEVAAGQADW
ncbi:anthranilate synthase component I [Miltoncostaea marina]|uniref:anthranilate synthase component I n=1 Tax=Miltoncostaea marina TaxID=2843215 RepID=UPI001C3D9A06|nr:anthranilate synthase component I [Miltoncostaea marina]